MAGIIASTRFAEGGTCRLTCFRHRTQRSLARGRIPTADASASGSGVPQRDHDSSKTPHAADGKAAVDKLLDEATAAADMATTALEHINDPPKSPKIQA